MIGDWWISTRLVCFVVVIMIDGSEKRSCEGGFLNLRVRMFVKSAIKMICSEKSDPENLFRRRHAREVKRRTVVRKGHCNFFFWIKLSCDNSNLIRAINEKFKNYRAIISKFIAR